VEADGVEPELGHVLVALHVDVRRLGPVTGIEEEWYSPGTWVTE
jgi:hypothetical protein